jgi:hypothetical protein
LLTKPRKYVHEFRLDLKETSDLSRLTDDLFEKEHHYLNP